MICKGKRNNIMNQIICVSATEENKRERIGQKNGCKSYEE